MVEDEGRDTTKGMVSGMVIRDPLAKGIITLIKRKTI
jgi:hypothetical protein